MSEQFIVSSDILIEIFNKGCDEFDCNKCPFDKLELYCDEVEFK